MAYCLSAFGNYLRAAKSDSIELLALLQSILLNKTDALQLQDELVAASINLDSILSANRELNQ